MPLLIVYFYICVCIIDPVHSPCILLHECQFHSWSKFLEFYERLRKIIKIKKKKKCRCPYFHLPPTTRSFDSIQGPHYFGVRALCATGSVTFICANKVNNKNKINQKRNTKQTQNVPQNSFGEFVGSPENTCFESNRSATIQGGRRDSFVRVKAECL